MVRIYILTAGSRVNKGFSTVLYPGEIRTNKDPIPSKLKWFDSFKGISNTKK